MVPTCWDQTYHSHPSSLKRHIISCHKYPFSRMYECLACKMVLETKGLIMPIITVESVKAQMPQVSALGSFQTGNT